MGRVGQRESKFRKTDSFVCSTQKKGGMIGQVSTQARNFPRPRPWPRQVTTDTFTVQIDINDSLHYSGHPQLHFANLEYSK
jgi:hypothetical protein